MSHRKREDSTMTSGKPKRKRDRLPKPRLGEPPGTVVASPDAYPTGISVIAYGPDKYEELQIKDIAGIPKLRQTWPVVWVNVDGLGDADIILLLGEMFDLHGLVLEDVISVPQRPKAEEYGENFFIVTKLAYAGDPIETEQISLFVGSSFVLSFQERPGDCLEPVRERIRQGKGRVRHQGADYLAYAIIDAVIDNYFPVLEDFMQRYEYLERLVIEKPDNETMSRIRRGKRSLLSLRHAVWPMREAVNTLLRDQIPPISKDTQLYLRDCYDHVTQLIDMVETFRELASGLQDAYMSSLSNKMNEVMKVLTVIATIFIPITFIAGIYGMNFQRMPELSYRWGYAGVWLVIIFVAAAMLVFFRRKGWIGGRGKEEVPGDDDK
jgi:magnesium transporter